MAGTDRPSAVDIQHVDKNVFLITPDPELMQQPGRSTEVQAFCQEVCRTAKEYGETNIRDAAVVVIDLSKVKSMNSYVIDQLALATSQFKEQSQLTKNTSRHRFVLAGANRDLHRLLDRVNFGDSEISVDRRSAPDVTARYVERYQPPADLLATPTPNPTPDPAPAPAPPPPKPDWKVERTGNAVVITPPEGTKITELAQGTAFAEKVKGFFPPPDDSHATKPSVVLDMNTVESLTGDAAGTMLTINNAAKKQGLGLTIANTKPDIQEMYKTMGMVRIINFSDKPVASLVAQANTPGANTQVS